VVWLKASLLKARKEAGLTGHREKKLKNRRERERKKKRENREHHYMSSKLKLGIESLEKNWFRTGTQDRERSGERF